MVTHRTLPDRTTRGWRYWGQAEHRVLMIGVSTSTVITLFSTLIVPMNMALGLGVLSLAITVVLVLPSPTNEEYMHEWISKLLRDRRIRKKKSVIQTMPLPKVLSKETYSEQREVSLGDIRLNVVPLPEAEGLLGEIQAGPLHTFSVTADGDLDATTPSDSLNATAGTLFGDIMADTAIKHGPGIRFCQFMYRLPFDPNDIAQFLVNNLQEPHPSIDPEVLQDRVENLFEATDLANDGATTPRSGIAVSALRPRSWSKKSPDQLTPRDLAQAPALLVSESLLEKLRSVPTITHVDRPSMYDLCGLIRIRLDPAQAPQYYTELWADLLDEREGGLTDPRLSRVLRQGAFPDEVRAENSYVSFGSTLHRVFYVPDYPIHEVPLGFFRPLYSELPNGALHSIALVYETVSLDKELKRAKRERTDRDVSRIERIRRGASGGPKEAHEDELIQSYESQMYFSGSLPVKSSLLTSVAGLSVPELNLAEQMLTARFNALRLPLRRITSPSRGLEALLMTMGIFVAPKM